MTITQFTNPKDFAPIVHAIGTDIEQTQVRIVASAMPIRSFTIGRWGILFSTSKRKKAGEAKLSIIYPRLYAHNIPIRKAIPLVTLSICVNSPKPILWRFYWKWVRLKNSLIVLRLIMYYNLQTSSINLRKNLLHN